MGRRRDVGEEIATSLVVEDGAETGVVERGVADLAAVQMEVLVEEQAEIAGAGAAVLHLDLADIDVLVEVDGVVHVQHEAEPAVGQGHVGHERVGLVADLPLPLRTVDPGEPPVSEHAEAARMADGVVLLAEVWEIDVAQTIVGVEHHLQRAVADDEVARHVRGVVCRWCGYPLLGSSGVAMTPCPPFVIGVGSRQQ
jgi:hypothetical protein